MEILGALKKSNSASSVFFCDYQHGGFNWDDVVKLLTKCRLMQDLDEKDIYCIAVESCDDMKQDKRLVGITFRNGLDFISLVPQEYSDLDFYLKEIADTAEENDK